MGALKPWLTGSLPGQPVQEDGRGHQWAGRRVELGECFPLPIPPPTTLRQAHGKAGNSAHPKPGVSVWGPATCCFYLKEKVMRLCCSVPALSGCGWLDENPVLPFSEPCLPKLNLSLGQRG